MKIGRRIVLIADKSLYEIWIRLSIDVSFLENVEENLGPILVTDRTADKVLKSIKMMRKITSKDKIIWDIKVRKDNQEYFKILEKTPFDLMAILNTIENEAKEMLDVLHKLDQGASLDDVNLIANARWIRSNTNFEPIIISDDRDLLTCGHILSSFFGLSLGFLSSFEILRLMELDEPFIRYCSHYTLREDLGSINNTWSKEALEREVSNAMRKARIACHPSLRGTGSLLRKIRR